MKKLPIHKIICGFCIAVVLAAITTIFWIAAVAESHAQPGVLTVLPIMNNREFMFTDNQIWGISVDFEGRIEMEHQSRMEIFTMTSRATAQVSTTGQHYFDIAFLPFVSGGAWAHDSADGAIISESLAWALFGSMDAVGLDIRTGNDDNYRITGVVRDTANRLGHVDGFAWIARREIGAQDNYASILHFIPESYNRLQTRIDAERILGLMNRRSDDYIILDAGEYTDGIALRGRVLMSLAGFTFIFFMMRLAYRIARQRQKKFIYHESLQGKKRWIWAAGITLGCAAIFALLSPYMFIDFWLPAFFPDGWRGYAQLFFNSGFAVSRQYLPNHMAALPSLNMWANLGFGAGVAALIAIFVLKKSGATSE